MANTKISSDRKEIVIGPNSPFTVIGERINPTGRKLLTEEMKAGNLDRVLSDAEAQVLAGAQMLDINAGVPWQMNQKYSRIASNLSKTTLIYLYALIHPLSMRSNLD